MNRFIFIMLWCWGCFFGGIPPIRGDFWWWKYILFWGHSMGWGAAWLEFLILFFGRMGLVLKTFPLSFSCPWSPSFRHPHFWRLSGSLLFWRLQRSFLFTVVFSPSFLGGLGPVLFSIFLVFFGIFSCLDLPGYAFYDFFSIIWVAGVCFWRVFKSTLKKWK